MLSPMKQMEAVLEGRLLYHEADPAVQSNLRLHIHQFAKEALSACASNPSSLKEYACKWPDSVRQEIIARARELWRQGVRK